LDTARNIQSAILPKKFPPFPEKNEFEIFAAMEPAKEVGGDLYDFFLLDGDRLGFVIGDVSGKGVPAAIFMAVSRTLIRATALKGIPPDECMTYVNNLLCNESVSSMFVTVFYGILNFKTGELHYANGGHNPPYIIKNNGELVTIELTDGLALGVIEGIVYKSNKIMLDKGDIIFTFTDGMTEAMNCNEELYSEERLENFLKGKKGTDVTTLIKESYDSVHAFADGAVQSDDLTALSIRLI
jgi:sigma-B regulation protein RsbU (phosphoserine phosphatase)